jgi:hypothetical protein
MKFSTRDDIEAPLDFVFAQASDFANFERQALRRGADLRRVDRLAKVGAGATWDASFVFRGRERQVRAMITDLDPARGYSVSLVSAGLDGETRVELVPLTPNRTRLSVELEIRPKTLAARLMVQSMKLTKSSLQKRLSQRVSSIAEDIGERWQRRG